jgi:hypothetical protein
MYEHLLAKKLCKAKTIGSMSPFFVKTLSKISFKMLSKRHSLFKFQNWKTDSDNLSKADVCESTTICNRASLLA